MSLVTQYIAHLRPSRPGVVEAAILNGANHINDLWDLIGGGEFDQQVVEAEDEAACEEVCRSRRSHSLSGIHGEQPRLWPVFLCKRSGG